MKEHHGKEAKEQKQLGGQLNEIKPRKTHTCVRTHKEDIKWKKTKEQTQQQLQTERTQRKDSEAKQVKERKQGLGKRAHDTK